MRTLSLAPGSFIEPGSVRGYYIDFRTKPKDAHWPPDWLPVADLHVAITQWALGCYEHYLASRSETWLAATCDAADYLLGVQVHGGRQDGGFVHRKTYPHTFRLAPPWLSSITQGQAASLFVRLYLETGKDRYAEAAIDALKPLDVPSSEGGVCAHLGGARFPEEYPTDPPSFVLNGGLFALFGIYDVATALGRKEHAASFAETARTFARNLHRWDLGYWSRYDLYPHHLSNVSSSAYHHLHVSQLDVLSRLAPNPEFREYRDRFADYEQRAMDRWHAFGRKVAFRLVVSRRRPLRPIRAA